MGGSGLISATWGFFNMRIALMPYHMLTYDHVIIYIRGYRDRLKKSSMPHISCKTCTFQYKPIWSDTIMVRGIWIFLMRARLRRISVFLSYRLGADIRACVIFSLILAYSLRDAVMDAQDKF